MATPEKTFELKVKAYLTSQGIYPAGYPKDRMGPRPVGWFFKMWGGGFSAVGIPDLILHVNGRFLGVELKAQNGRPSELQTLNVRRIRESGGQACFLYPSGFSEFKKDLFTLSIKEVYK